ncbi:MAG: serine protease, partial [Chloroflexota bacterium]
KVVTAAHCLTRNAARGDYRFRAGLPGNIRLYRAYSAAAGGSRYPSCGVSRAWAPSRFIRRDSSDRKFGSPAHDYAVLTTSRGCSYPRNSVLRMWPTTLSGGELKTGNVVKFAGYPLDPRFARMNGLNLWRTRGKIQSSRGDAKLLRMTGFVARGMSGGPVWRSFKNNSPCGRSECMVGLITECAVNSKGLCKLGDSVRRAVRITPAVKRAIRNH